ncbi:MAG TPA: hypothetical protein VL979_08160 [Solirubrobacteraceae bacterium]|nr:hypothetical protein [Solirubrobacteraceae bacterium]
MPDKALNLLLAVVFGAAVLTAAAPTLLHVVDALVPLALVVGSVAITWKLIDYFTRE